jgi:hypothetical protein
MIKRFFPEDYGAVGNGIADDSAAISRAFVAINVVGAGILDVSRGLYRLGSTVIMSYVENLAVVGGGPGTGFVVTGSFSPDWSYTALTTRNTGGLGASTTVSSIAGEGTSGVAVASPIFQAGDTVVISFVSGARSGCQHNIVSSVGGNSVFLAKPLPFDVSTGTVIQKVTHRRGLRLEGFSVVAHGQAVEHAGLLVTYERDAVISDLTFEGQGTYVPSQTRGGALNVSDGLDNRIVNVSAHQGGSNGQNAIAFYQQTGLSAQGVYSERGAFGIGITRSSQGCLCDLRSNRDTARAIKLFGAHHMQMFGVEAGPAAHVGLGFSGGSSNNIATGVNVLGIQGGQAQGIWFNGDGNIRNTVLSARVRVAPGGSVVIPAGDTNNYVQLVSKLADTIYNSEPTSRVMVL